MPTFLSIYFQTALVNNVSGHERVFFNNFIRLLSQGVLESHIV